MNASELKKVREKMCKAIQIYHYEVRVPFGEPKPKCPSIQKMADYLKAKHPTLYVCVSDSCDTKPRENGLPYTTSGGEILYEGKRLVVTNGDERIINHSTIDTYRFNVEVAEKIIEYEKDLDEVAK